MAKRRKETTEGGRGAGPSPQLEPERVQARADQVVLALRIADFGTPDKDGMVALELLEPTAVRGVLIGPHGASEATGIVIEELRLRVPTPARPKQSKPGRPQARSGPPRPAPR